MIKAIIFDCFGVLMLDAHTSYFQLHQEHAEQLSELNRQADAGFIDRADLINGYCDITKDDYNYVENYLLKEHQVNQPLVELIKKLKKDYKIGMISNIGRSWYDQIVPEDVRSLFNETIISGEVGMVKPYPEIFELACHRLDMQPSDIIFIDDILDNCEGAKAVGMQSIHYKNLKTLNGNLNKLIL